MRDKIECPLSASSLVGQGANHARTSDSAALDTITYWLSIISLYVLEGALWYYPFKAKVFDDGLIAPDGIMEQFAGTLIDSFPGTSVSWAILVIFQGLIVVALAASLLRREFLPRRRKPILLGALTMSLIAFAMLFGSSMTSQFDSVASISTYFGVTVVLLVFVLLLPPYRPTPLAELSASWLS